MGRGICPTRNGSWQTHFLPSECVRLAGLAGGNLRFFRGILYVLRVACPWRDVHERYGK